LGGVATHSAAVGSSRALMVRRRDTLSSGASRLTGEPAVLARLLK